MLFFTIVPPPPPKHLWDRGGQKNSLQEPLSFKPHFDKEYRNREDRVCVVVVVCVCVCVCVYVNQYSTQCATACNKICLEKICYLASEIGEL